MEISLSLKSEGYNSYREFALDKAKFEGKIKFLDILNLHNYQLDKIILGK